MPKSANQILNILYEDKDKNVKIQLVTNKAIEGLKANRKSENRYHLNIGIFWHGPAINNSNDAFVEYQPMINMALTARQAQEPRFQAHNLDDKEQAMINNCYGEILGLVENNEDKEILKAHLDSKVNLHFLHNLHFEAGKLRSELTFK